jgi:hypothetical protein
MCLLIINVVIYSDGGAFGQTVNHTESQEQRSCSVGTDTSDCWQLLR